MSDSDIRWHQRLDNYERALEQMQLFVEEGEQLNKLERQGLIKAFEYTYELGWNVLKDYLEYQGNTDLHGSRDVIREAFRVGLIEGESWMAMLADRNRTSHTYNEAVAEEIAGNALKQYYPILLSLQERMRGLRQEGEHDIR